MILCVALEGFDDAEVSFAAVFLDRVGFYLLLLVGISIVGTGRDRYG
jgi:hypothetical protein